MTLTDLILLKNAAWISLAVLEMTFAATILIFAVLILRVLFRKLPKSYSCLLWLLVLVRLLCPFSFQSSLSLLPQSNSVWEFFLEKGEQFYAQNALKEKKVITENDPDKEAALETWASEPNQLSNDGTVTAENAAIQSQMSGRKLQLDTFSQLESERSQRDIEDLPAAVQKTCSVVSIIWILGVIFLGSAYLVQYLHLLKKIRSWKADKTRNFYNDGKTKDFCKAVFTGASEIMEHPEITEPFVLGIVHPMICLPEAMAEEDRNLILLHEKMHIRHLDTLQRFLWQTALVIHWFNPFVWLAVKLVQKDMEMFCDESVLSYCEKGTSSVKCSITCEEASSGKYPITCEKTEIECSQLALRKAYALTLLRFSAKRSGLPFPVAFGESNTESRIKHILKVKRPAFLVSILAVLVILLAAVCFLTKPENSADSETELEKQKVLEQEALIEDKLEAMQKLQEKLQQEVLQGESEKESDETQDQEAKKELVERWAEAFANKDGEAMVLMSADLSVMEQWKEGEGSYHVGWSSPWPWNDYREILTTQNPDEYLIYYYANTSDPHITVWKEKVTVTEKNGEYVIADSQLDMSAIQSAEAFNERYRRGFYEGENNFYYYSIYNTPLDVDYSIEEGEQTIADVLLDKEKNNEPGIQQYLTPENAAAWQLDLQSGKGVEEVSPYPDKKCLRWQFADESTDVIVLGHPVPSDGIPVTTGLWVVENILKEEEYQTALKQSMWRNYYLKNPDKLKQDSLHGTEGMMEALQNQGNYVILLSELEEEDIALYGLVCDSNSAGTLLYYEGRCQYFDWYYCGTRLILPELYNADYNNDGNEELAVILCGATGTGVNIEQLFILQRTGGQWQAEEFTSKNYLAQISQQITCIYQEETNTIQFFDEEKGILLGENDLTPILGEERYGKTMWGSIVSFVPEDERIYLQAKPEFVPEGRPVGWFNDTVLRARVVYGSEGFSLEEFEIVDLGVS